MVEQRFCPEMAVHIRRMTGVTLERDLLSGKMQVSSVLLPSEERAPSARRTALEVAP
jgi:hypothetical protein